MILFSGRRRFHAAGSGRHSARPVRTACNPQDGFLLQGCEAPCRGTNRAGPGAAASARCRTRRRPQPACPTAGTARDHAPLRPTDVPCAGEERAAHAQSGRRTRPSSGRRAPAAPPALRRPLAEHLPLGRGLRRQAVFVGGSWADRRVSDARRRRRRAGGRSSPTASRPISSGDPPPRPALPPLQFAFAPVTVALAPVTRWDRHQTGSALHPSFPGRMGAMSDVRMCGVCVSCVRVCVCPPFISG